MRKRYKGLSYGMPLALSDELIEAVLRKTKTHTVRSLSSKDRSKISGEVDGLPAYRDSSNRLTRLTLPYGEIGDYLWIREPYRISDGTTEYRMVSDPDRSTPNDEWLPVVGMPEEFSRICLLITGYKYLPGVQHLSVEDIEKEGFTSEYPPGKRYNADIRNSFARYWNTRYRASVDKWEANPPVWIAEFVLLSHEESAALKKAKDYLR